MPDGQAHAGAPPGFISGLGSGIGGATPWGAIANLAGGIISGITGASQRHKGKKILAGLQFPTESMPTEVIENQNAARSMASQGLPSEQYAQAMRNIQRQQLMAIRGAQDRRGGLGSISGIQQGTNDATLNLDSADAQAHLANQRNLMAVNNQVAGWKSQLFDRNVRQKYQQDRDYAMQVMGAGNQNLTSGLDKIGAGGVGLFGNSRPQNQYYGGGYY